MKLRFGFPLAVLVGVLTFSAAAQEKGEAKADDKYSAPVEWRRYRVSAAESSFLMPKLPVKNDLTFSCAEKRGVTYHAYANEVVYEFRFYVKEPKSRFPCIFLDSFSSAMNARLNELRTGHKPPPVSEVDGEVNGRKVKIFRWETEKDKVARWVFMDGFKSHWVEVSVGSRLDVNPETERFLGSLGPISPSDTELLQGAESYLGDARPMRIPVLEQGKESVKQGILLYGQPKASYTDEAKKKDIEGNVILNVSFLANGGIGEITVLKPLSHGLTEQAIAAARRLVFIPARENGVPVTTVRKVEYVFNLY